VDFSSDEANGFKAVNAEVVFVFSVEDVELAGAELEENGLDNPVVKEDKVELALEVVESTVCLICPGILLSSSVYVTYAKTSEVTVTKK
jgi:hypothetical protein